MASTTAETPVVGPTRIRLPVQDERVNDLLLWRDPKKSAAVLLVATALFTTLRVVKVSFFVALAYSIIAIVLAFNIYAFAAKAAHRSPLPLPAAVRYGVTEEQAKSLAEKSTPCFNKVLSKVNLLLGGSHPGYAAATVVGLYLLARLSTAFTLSGVLFFLIVVAFTLPKIYELKKELIDSHLDNVRSKATDIYDKHLHGIVQKIPRARAAEPVDPLTAEPELVKKVE